MQYLVWKKKYIQISGTLEASDNPSDYSEDRRYWLIFDSVQKLSVKGGGTIDGNGNIWWQNSCKRNKKLVRYIYYHKLKHNIVIYIYYLYIVRKSYLNANHVFLCFSLFCSLARVPLRYLYMDFIFYILFIWLIPVQSNLDIPNIILLHGSTWFNLD